MIIIVIVESCLALMSDTLQLLALHRYYHGYSMAAITLLKHFRNLILAEGH